HRWTVEAVLDAAASASLELDLPGLRRRHRQAGGASAGARFSKAVTARICQKKIGLFPRASRDRVLMQLLGLGLDVQARGIRARPLRTEACRERAREVAPGAGRSGAHQPRHHNGPIDRVAGARDQTPIGAGINSANACLRWLARERPDVERRAKPPREWSTMRSGRPKSFDRVGSLYKRALRNASCWTST